MQDNTVITPLTAQELPLEIFYFDLNSSVILNTEFNRLKCNISEYIFELTTVNLKNKTLFYLYYF